MRRIGLAIAVGVALIAVAVAALSQGSAGAGTRSGTVKGTVSQKVYCVRAPCPPLRKRGVEVIARRGSRSRTATTDSRGGFTLHLPRGHWRVTARADGQRAAKTVRVRAGRTSRVDLVLGLG